MSQATSPPASPSHPIQGFLPPLPSPHPTLQTQLGTESREVSGNTCPGPRDWRSLSSGDHYCYYNGCNKSLAQKKHSNFHLLWKGRAHQRQEQEKSSTFQKEKRESGEMGGVKRRRKQNEAEGGKKVVLRCALCENPKKKNLKHVTCVPPCRNKIHMLIRAGPPRSREDNCRPLSVSRASKRRATNGLKEPGEQSDRM